MKELKRVCGHGGRLQFPIIRLAHAVVVNFQPRSLSARFF